MRQVQLILLLKKLLLSNSEFPIYDTSSSLISNAFLSVLYDQHYLVFSRPHIDDLRRSLRDIFTSFLAIGRKKFPNFMASKLGEPLIHERLLGKSVQASQSFKPDPQINPRRRITKDSLRQIQMFLHGGESSIVTEQGEYNVHRMVPRFVKYYLNWTRDTFPSVVRLSWVSLMTLFISIKLITISFFAIIMKSLDGSHEAECVTNARSYSDFFYFVVQTIFTIGYGDMSPVCHWSNVMVTIISFFGMFQTATFTGIFFAKFSMDPRRNFACAFSTKLVGIPPSSSVETPAIDDAVRFNFRFVNVFHRRYFKVSARMYLIEHRINSITEQWLPPLVEEQHFFDTSAPLEFMSLPIEVCCYVPYSRLVRLQSRVGSPLVSATDSPSLASEGSIHGVSRQHRHNWIRYFSNQYRQKHQMDLSHPSTPRTHFTQHELDIPINSEFEIMCMLVFTDATTSSEIAVRKSWPLADTLWLTQSESSVRWKNIIHRDEKSDKYLVDVTGLDLVDNPSSGIAIPPGAAESSLDTVSMRYRLINSMTMPAKGGQLRAAATDIFPSPISEERV